MSKYHINSQGIAKECRAQQGKCPFGPHFNNQREAEQYADKYNEYLTKVHSDEIKEQYQNIKEEFDLSDLEFQKQIEYAEKPIEELTIDVEKSLNRKLSKSDVNELKCAVYEVSRCRDDLPTRMILKGAVPKDIEEELSEVFKKALPQSRSKFPAMAVWETSQGYHIWTDNNKYLDMVYVSKKSRTITTTEFKDLTTGAQIHQTIMAQNEDGSLIVDRNNKFISDKMAKALEEYNPRESWNEDKVINLTDLEANTAFVLSHMEMQCSKLIYTNKQGNQELVWFKGSPEHNAQQLLNKNVVVTFKIRNNNIGNSRAVNDEDIKYFNTHYGEFFKNGKVPENGKFTILDLDKNHYKFSGPSDQYVKSDFVWERTAIPEDDRSTEILRFGEFGIRKKDFQYNDVLDIKDFVRMKPVITGTIEDKTEVNG